MSDSKPIESSESSYEKRDANLRSILFFGVILVAVTVVALLLMRLMFNAFEAREARLDIPPSPLANTRGSHSEPRLQVAPARELNEVRAREDTLLNSYSWIDKDAGIVRIPISRAMELLAKRGLPVRKQGDEEVGK